MKIPYNWVHQKTYHLTIVKCNKCHRINAALSGSYWFNACYCTGNPKYESKTLLDEFKDENM